MRVDLAEVMRIASHGNFHPCKKVLNEGCQHHE